MAICKNCGLQSEHDAGFCPRCGSQLTPDWHSIPYQQPYQPAPQPQPKRGKAPYIVLFSLIGVLLIMAGVACFMIFNSEPARPKLFHYSCEDFTNELNKSLAADSTFGFQINSDKWVPNDDEKCMEYTENGMNIKIKTEKENDVKSKIEQIRIANATQEKSRRMAALSVAALKSNNKKTDDTERKSIEEKLKKLTDGTSEKEVVDDSQITYDKDKGEFVIEPAHDDTDDTKPQEDSKSGDGVAATKPVNSEPEYSGYIAGNGYVSVGDAIICADGEKITYKKTIDDAPKTIATGHSDGKVLTDGKTVYFVQFDKYTPKEYKILYKNINDDETLELKSFDSPVVLLHYYNDCLYYALQDKGVMEYHLYKYDTLEAKAEMIKAVSFSPYSVAVKDNMMYYSMVPGGVGFMKSIHTYSFNFDTEEVKKEKEACQVIREGLAKGLGNPVLNSYTDDSMGNLSNHYLYTMKDGKPEKSKEIIGKKQPRVASPTSDKAILVGFGNNNANTGVYLFDRATGDEKTVYTADLSGGRDIFATFDLKHPDIFYIACCDTNGRDVAKVVELYQVTDSGVKKCSTDATIELRLNIFAVSDGKILDYNYKTHKINTGDSVAEQPSTAASAKDYSGYVGTWYKELPNAASHFVVIKSVEGSTISFTVNTVFPRASRVSLSKPITGEIVDGKVEFEYKDSFDNTGSGTLELGDGYVSADVKSNKDGMGSFIEYNEKFTVHNDNTGENE